MTNQAEELPNKTPAQRRAVTDSASEAREELASRPPLPRRAAELAAPLVSALQALAVAFDGRAEVLRLPGVRVDPERSACDARSWLAFLDEAGGRCRMGGGGSGLWARFGCCLTRVRSTGVGGHLTPPALIMRMCSKQPPTRSLSKADRAIGFSGLSSMTLP